MSAAALLTWTPTQAAAQTAAQSPQPSGLSEVVVTARRRAERLQDVPVVVTVINQQKLAEAQVTTARQLVQFVPSLNIGSGNLHGYQRFTIRGQGASLGSNEAVAVYVDDAPYPQFGAGGPGMYFDLENLQVLNGPQGTLFGRNTTGGAVLFTPSRPVDRNEGSIQVGYGNYNNREITGVANVAVVPGVLDVRLAGEMRKRDGYTTDYWDHSHFDDINYKAFRLGISFKPTSYLQNYLLLSYIRNDTEGTSFFLTDVNQSNTPPFPNGKSYFPSGLVFGRGSSRAPGCNFAAPVGLNCYLALQQQLGVRTTLSTAPHFWFEEDTRAVDTTTIDLPANLTLKNIASFDREQVAGGFDIDGTPDPIVQWNPGPIVQNPSGFGVSKNDYLTEELQLAGKALNNKFTWVGGAFYEHYYSYGPQGQDVVQFGRLLQSYFAESGVTKALFAQGTLDLGVVSPVLDQLKFTAGYRYTWDDKQYLSNQSALGSLSCNAGVPPAPAVFPNCAVNYAGAWSAPTFTVGLDYKINRNVLIYGKRSTGYKSGGFNGGTSPLLSIASFGPEKVTDYEIGVKADTQLFDIPIRADFAGFHDLYTQIQRNQSFATGNPPQVVNVITNAGAATIDGFEAQIDAHLHAFDVSLNYSYLNARYTSFVLVQPQETPATGTDLKGVQLPYAPTHKVGGAVTYHLPVDEALGKISVNAAANYQSTYRWGDLNQPGNILGNYALVDFGADWDQFMGHPVHIEAFVTNVFDRKDKAGSLAYYYTVGQSAASYIEPRMYGFRVRYSFGGS